MRELALHVLDILQNTVEAGATRVTLTIHEDMPADRLTIAITDNGRGMDAETAVRVINPFYTTRTTRHVGLGVPLYAMAAEQAGGGLRIASQPGLGTTVEAVFQLSHPDRQPLGDMAGTLLAFLLSERTPELRYAHRIRRGEPSVVAPEAGTMVAPGAGTVVAPEAGTVVAPGAGTGTEAPPLRFEFDTADIRAELGDIPFTHPAVAHWLAEFLEEGENVLRVA